jgi:hypothetical protein
VRCGETKDVAEFNRSPKNRDGLHSYCRSCQRAHYLENGERHRANVRATSRRRRAALRDLVRSQLGTGCVDCGNLDIRVLEFDHVRGVKLGNISDLVRRGRSAASIEAEMAKCEVRCSNCHAIVTAERRLSR